MRLSGRSIADLFGLGKRKEPSPRLDRQPPETAMCRLGSGPADTGTMQSNRPPIKLDFPSSIRSEYPAQFDPAWKAVEEIAAVIRGVDFSQLARRSPGLDDYDWASYLRLSTIRMVRAYASLQHLGFTSGRLLDVGSYFGNFALLFRNIGFAVEAMDSYEEYCPAFDSILDLLADRGIVIRDSADAGTNMANLSSDSYDVVLCMGVLEHVPHTPRLLLEGITRVLRPGGVLVLDTPNLAYIYKRQALAQGQSVFPPIELQYRTEIPFEGHHREYTISEVKWMLEKVGHELLKVETFNFSLFGLEKLEGRDLENYIQMEAREDLREIIFAVSRKPKPTAAAPVQG